MVMSAICNAKHRHGIEKIGENPLVLDMETIGRIREYVDSATDIQGAFRSQD